MFSADIKLIFPAVLAACMIGTALPASAGQFNVKPIRVFLGKDAASAILTVENQAPTVLRLQVRAYAWRNDLNGQPVLLPTDDLIVFPALVDIAPMERRSIRIGFSGNAGDKELSYRVALDEMPSLESQLSARRQPGLEVRTRITIPVFFTPLVATDKAEIDGISLTRSGVQAVFRNTGNVHATVSNAQIVARDGGGATLLDKRINGWYVLPGEEWDVTANASRLCGRVKSVSVTVQSDIGRFTRTAGASSLGCR